MGRLHLREQLRAVAELVHRNARALEQRQVQVRQRRLVLVLQVLSALQLPASAADDDRGQWELVVRLLLLMLLPYSRIE